MGDSGKDAVEELPATGDFIKAQRLASSKEIFVAAQSEQETYVRASRKCSAWLLPLLMTTIAIVTLEHSTLNLAGQRLAADLELSATMFGVAAGIYYIPLITLSWPQLWVIKHVPARYWLGLMLAIAGIALFSIGYVQNFGQLLFLRLVLGAAEAGVQPIIYYYLGLFLTPNDMVHLWSIIAVGGQPFGTVLACPLIATIMWQLDGVWGLSDWQWVFFICGLLTLLTAVAILTLLLDTPSKTTVLTDKERDVLVQMKARVSQVADAEKNFDIVSALTSPISLYLGVLGMLLNGPTSLFQFFLTATVSQVTATQVSSSDPADTAVISAFLSMIPFLVVGMSIVVQSNLLRGWNTRRARLNTGTVLLSIALVMFMLFQFVYELGITSLSFAYLVLMAGIYTPGVYSDALPALFLQMNGAAPAFFAIYSSVKHSSSIFAPVLMGWLIETTGSETMALVYLDVAFIAPALLMYVGFYQLMGEGYCQRPKKLPTASATAEEQT